MFAASVSSCGNINGVDYNFDKILTSLPKTLTDLSATYTRASKKTVKQNGQYVSLESGVFGTTYDYLTGKYYFNSESAATNLCLRSTLEGGGSVPTGWTVGTANSGGTSTSTASLLGNADNCLSYVNSVTAARNYNMLTITGILALRTYFYHLDVESVTAGVAANSVIFAAQTGSTITYPVCEANPSGGGTGVINAGRIVIKIVTTGTGSLTIRWGIGCNASTTGTVQLSRPQVELDIQTSFIATTTATASRAADILSFATSSVTGFSDAGYTLYLDARSGFTHTAASIGLSVNDSSTANAARISLTTSDNAEFSMSAASVSQVSSTSSVGLTRFKAAMSCSLNNTLMSINGATVTADTVCVMPVTPNKINIGCDGASDNQFNSAIFGFKFIINTSTQAYLNGLTQ